MHGPGAHTGPREQSNLTRREPLPPPATVRLPQNLARRTPGMPPTPHRPQTRRCLLPLPRRPIAARPAAKARTPVRRPPARPLAAAGPGTQAARGSCWLGGTAGRAAQAASGWSPVQAGSPVRPVGRAAGRSRGCAAVGNRAGVGALTETRKPKPGSRVHKDSG